MPTALEIAALNSDAINPDRLKLGNLQATFFRSEDDNLDYCRIVNMHDQGKNDLIQRVNPSHVQRWPKLWAAYQSGRSLAPQTGTPLRKVPGMDEATALVFQLNNVPNTEALAKLDDLHLDAIVGEAVGKGLRAGARLVLRAQRADELEKDMDDRTKPDQPAGVSNEAAAQQAKLNPTGQGQAQQGRR